jgi:hypothetical protein
VKKVNYLEAVRAVKEGECKQIKSLKTKALYSFNIHDNKIFSVKNMFFSPYTNEVLGEWELIGVKPKTEEREATVYLVVLNNGSVVSYTRSVPTPIRVEAQHVFEFKQKYIYTYPEEG